jgi:plastocyanin
MQASAAPKAANASHLYQVNIGVDFYYRSIVVNEFFPDKLTIHAGDRVRFTNITGSRPQTVTFGPILNTPNLIPVSPREVNSRIVQPRGGTVVDDPSFNVYSSGALMSGVAGLHWSYTFSFPNPGTYLYRSLFHPSSLGEIDVVAKGKPASPVHPDLGPSYYNALRSAAQVLSDSFATEKAGANAAGPLTITIGGGDGNISLAKFTPAGITVTVGTTVTWTIAETSGDPHSLVFGNVDQSVLRQPFYSGLAPDGGLYINESFAFTTLTSGSAIDGASLSGVQDLGLIPTSGVLYGSSINYPSVAPSTYTLVFDSPGDYYYYDMAPPTAIGEISVVAVAPAQLPTQSP